MENAVIPLVINQAAGQEFRINLHTATIPDPNVYLEDVEEGTFTNLYEGDFVYTPTSDLEWCWKILHPHDCRYNE